MPGDMLTVESERADRMVLDRHKNPVWRNHAHVMEVKGNPVTGPIYVEGAEASDQLAVTIHDIVLDNTEGLFTYTQGQGIFCNDFYPDYDPPPCTQFCDVSGKEIVAEFSGKAFHIPIRPFIGTMSVAPAERTTISYFYGKDILGNVDCRHVCKGSTIVLPVNQPGALLSLGDFHAAQGAGEILGCAVEARGHAVISVQVIKAKENYPFDWPQVNTERFIGSIGCMDNSLEAAVRHAVYDLIKRVERLCQISFMDAFMLLGQCIEIEICQFTGSMRSAIAKLDRQYLVGYHVDKELIHQ